MALQRSTRTSIPDYKQLCKLIYEEFTKNINWYRSFASDTTDVIKDIQNYLEDKHYASDVGDLVLYALETPQKHLPWFLQKIQNVNLSYPVTSNESRNITKLLKSDQHYNVIVFGNTGNRLSIPIFKKRSQFRYLCWVMLFKLERRQEVKQPPFLFYRQICK